MISKIKEYSKVTNFNNLDLIKKLILHKEDRINKLLKTLHSIHCEKCGSNSFELELSDDEYSDERYIYCNNCDEILEDNELYIKTYDELYLEDYYDLILNDILMNNHKNISENDWHKLCTENIYKMLNSTKR